MPGLPAAGAPASASPAPPPPAAAAASDDDDGLAERMRALGVEVGPEPEAPAVDASALGEALRARLDAAGVRLDAENYERLSRRAALLLAHFEKCKATGRASWLYEDAGAEA